MLGGVLHVDGSVPWGGGGSARMPNDGYRRKRVCVRRGQAGACFLEVAFLLLF